MDFSPLQDSSLTKTAVPFAVRKSRCLRAGSGIDQKPDEVTTDQYGHFRLSLTFAPMYWKLAFILRVEKPGFKTAEVELNNEAYLDVVLPRESDSWEPKFLDKWKTAAVGGGSSTGPGGGAAVKGSGTAPPGPN